MGKEQIMSSELIKIAKSIARKSNSGLNDYMIMGDKMQKACLDISFNTEDIDAAICNLENAYEYALKEMEVIRLVVVIAVPLLLLMPLLLPPQYSVAYMNNMKYVLGSLLVNSIVYLFVKFRNLHNISYSLAGIKSLKLTQPEF